MNGNILQNFFFSKSSPNVAHSPYSKNNNKLKKG